MLSAYAERSHRNIVARLAIVSKLRQQLAAATLVPALTAATEAMKLWWATKDEDLFYDQENMWRLRYSSLDQPMQNNNVISTCGD
eukprot:scaffold414901_cov23-Prasinocladus_malaysianus.AAC.1